MELIFISTMLETVILVIFLAIVFVAGKIISHKKRMFFGKKQLPARVEASAIILNVEQTGIYANQRAQVRLQMQVLPERGRNFIAEFSQLLSASDLALIQNGCMVKVQYNPANTKEVVLVKAA